MASEFVYALKSGAMYLADTHWPYTFTALKAKARTWEDFESAEAASVSHSISGLEVTGFLLTEITRDGEALW